MKKYITFLSLIITTISSITAASYNSPQTPPDRIAVLVTPAEVNDVVNTGYFGNYVADLLMEDLLMNDKIKLLDRGVLSTQLTEMQLAGDAIDKNSAIKRGKIIGAKYVIQCTMQKPDVVNVKTGIPLASVMGAVGTATGQNMGATYASNISKGALKAVINISTRVIDLETSEVMFMTSAVGTAQGKSQISLEYGALGGLEIYGGASGFKQTITGQAIEKAFSSISSDLDMFFDGRATSRVSKGNLTTPIVDKTMNAKGMNLYLGVSKLDKEGVQLAFANDPDLYFKYKKAKRMQIIGLASVVPIALAGIAIANPSTDTYHIDPDSDYDINQGDISGGAIAGAVIVGVGVGSILYYIGNKQLKSITSRYNTRHPVDLALGFTNNGLGLTLKF